MANQLDFKNDKGEWVQRAIVGSKFTYTISGMLWNNIKERCTVGGATQLRETTYIGCTNGFTGFQEFTDWHMNQIGYGLGYQLDADILQDGAKRYGEETCLLIPAALNKFLQSYAGQRGYWPQGVTASGKKIAACITEEGIKQTLGYFNTNEVETARAVYKAAKDKVGAKWVEKLMSDDFTVDPRAIEYMRKWEHICDWTPA